ncbi:hypothetical protein [Fulvitalea axinellae]
MEYNYLLKKLASRAESVKMERVSTLERRKVTLKSVLRRHPKKQSIYSVRFQLEAKGVGSFNLSVRYVSTFKAPDIAEGEPLKKSLRASGYAELKNCVENIAEGAGFGSFRLPSGLFGSL